MRRFLSVTALLATLILGAGAVGVRAEEPFRIVPGVVFEVYAVGIPAFRYRVEVNAAGEAAFPLLDPEQVTGMTMPDLRDLLRSRFVNRVFRQWGSDGQLQLVNILPEEIVVDIAAYPPVYVGGDVGRQGEIAYRPAMTVRQAITQAGGANRGHGDGASSLSEVADLQGEHAELLVELAAAQARRAVLAAQIEGQPLPEAPRVDVALNPAILRRIAGNEVQRARASEAAFAETRSRLGEQLAAIEQQLLSLDDERRQMSDRMARQMRQLDEVAGWKDSGLVTSSRHLEEQRQTEFVQDRVSMLESRRFDIEIRRDTTRAELETAANAHRLALLTDQQEVDIRIAALTVRQRTLEERLTVLGATVGRSGRAGRPDIRIHRIGQPQPVPAEEDTVLHAGDVVEVVVPGSGLLDGL